MILSKQLKSLEESGLLIIAVSETIKNEEKEQKGWFFGMLLCTSGASLLGNLLTGKGTIRAAESITRADEETIRARPDFMCHLILILKYKIIIETNLNWIEFKFNLKHGTYAINLHDYKSIGTHWVALYVNGNNIIIHFYRFGAEHIPKKS